MMMIETPRLILRPPVMRDAKEITAAKQAVWPELQCWMSWAHEGEDTLDATERFIASISDADQHLIGLCKESGRFVISTGLHWRNCGSHRCPHTGYWVAQDFLGKGYATESTNAVIRHAFYAQKAEAVYIDYFEGNEKSRRVIEKLGFSPFEVKAGAIARGLDGALMTEHWYVMRDPSVLPPLDVRWKGMP